MNWLYYLQDHVVLDYGEKMLTSIKVFIFPQMFFKTFFIYKQWKYKKIVCFAGCSVCAAAVLQLSASRHQSSVSAQVYAHRSVVDPSLLTDDDPQRSSRTIGRISGTGIVLNSKSVEISKSDPFNWCSAFCTLRVFCILFIDWSIHQGIPR